jgi:hypothetical protein
MTVYPTPHLDKLNATLANEKLPPDDKPRIERAIERHRQWVQQLDKVEGTPEEILERMVSLLTEYKTFIDLDLIFDSEQDFLYRQAGQLKLNNSVIEEFLPHLIRPSVIPEIEGFTIEVGPTNCYSSVYFSTSLDTPAVGGGLEVRSKDQDFAISKRLYLKASHHQDYSECVEKATNIAFVVSECKTNLDKTMFQEACATAHDVKTAVSGARYYLLAEWLDMSPLSTAPTDIDEVLLLRQGKRVNSNIRSQYATIDGRRRNRDAYIRYLNAKKGNTY